MMPLVYGALACVQAGLALLLLSRKAWIPGVVGLGIAADSAIIALGAGESLNFVRFAVHAVLTPLLIGYVAMLHRVLVRTAWIAAAALIVVDTVALADLRLEPRAWAGTLRYVSAESSPPVAALITTAALLAAGVATWRRHGSPWLFFSALFLLVASGAGVVVPILGNLGEAVMLAGLWTAATVSRHAAERKQRFNE
ncbi:hypothetical protein ACIBH1_27990 [Nonomuraea sp. NPDC050663]|uniref:hypothetical protein n=1 Tax=Nonomuraea sp. NPDC050663 TaxID=3364370 RepID=UPI00379B96FA